MHTKDFLSMFEARIKLYKMFQHLVFFQISTSCPTEQFILENE